MGPRREQTLSLQTVHSRQPQIKDKARRALGAA
jgi:hypothetical protein